MEFQDTSNKLMAQAVELITGQPLTENDLPKVYQNTSNNLLLKLVQVIANLANPVPNLKFETNNDFLIIDAIYNGDSTNCYASQNIFLENRFISNGKISGSIYSFENDFKALCQITLPTFTNSFVNYKDGEIGYFFEVNNLKNVGTIYVENGNIIFSQKEKPANNVDYVYYFSAIMQ